jgi:citrate synthase
LSQKGLEGVVAAQTAISDIDVENSKLMYAGYDVTDLVNNSTFEEVIYLLHHRELPNEAKLQALTAQLAAERDLHDFTKQLMVTLSSTTRPTSARPSVLFHVCPR